MRKIIELLKKYIFNKEMILYLIMGVLATAVNLAVYAISVRPLKAICPDQTVYIGGAKLIAWVVAVIFAFFTNKIWVFESRSWAPRIFWKEFISFIGARAQRTGPFPGCCFACLSGASGNPIFWRCSSSCGNLLAKWSFCFIIPCF